MGKVIEKTKKYELLIERRIQMVDLDLDSITKENLEEVRKISERVHTQIQADIERYFLKGERKGASENPNRAIGRLEELNL